MTGSPNTSAGDALLAERLDAERALIDVDSDLYSQVEHWLDSELYGGLFGHGGVKRIPLGHKPLILRVLRARAAVYRGRRFGFVVVDRGRTYDSEVGNEQMAQTIDNCLEYLGAGESLPDERGCHWDKFMPEAFRR